MSYEWKHLRELRDEEEIDIELTDGSVINNVTPYGDEFYWRKLNVYFDSYLVVYWREHV